MTPLVQVENVGPKVGRLNLLRPEKRNALSIQMAGDATAAIEQMETLGIEIGILASTGPIFCGGADLSEDHSLLPGVPSALDLPNRLLTSRIFWIAAVQGPALGMGTSLVASCPLSVVSREAWFGLPEISFGVYPSAAIAYLERRLSRQFCMEWALLDKRYPADASEMSSLVSVLCESPEVSTLAEQLALRLAQTLPAARSARKAWQSDSRSHGFLSRLDESAALLNEQLDIETVKP